MGLNVDADGFKIVQAREGLFTRALDPRHPIPYIFQVPYPTLDLEQSSIGHQFRSSKVNDNKDGLLIPNPTLRGGKGPHPYYLALPTPRWLSEAASAAPDWMLLWSDDEFAIDRDDG